MTETDLEADLRWTEGLRFEARTAGGAVTSIDGETALSPSPMELLLEALAGCTGCDVVEILRKGRHELEGLGVEIRGTRREEPPRRFQSLTLVFRVIGPVERSAAERAVELSLEKYCSVFHTLREDLSLETEVVMEDAPAAGAG